MGNAMRAVGALAITAIQQHLGLKFEPTRAPVEVLVIEKPSAN